MYYIQKENKNSLETVNRFNTRSEARKMLREYRLSDSFAYYYISTKCCENWFDK